VGTETVGACGVGAGLEAGSGGGAGLGAAEGASADGPGGAGSAGAAGVFPADGGSGEAGAPRGVEPFGRAVGAGAAGDSARGRRFFLAVAGTDPALG